MPGLLSHAYIEARLNGFSFTGWAEDDPPYDFEFDSSKEFKMGQDGGLYGLSKPALGGLLTLKFDPASPSTQWCIRQEQTRKNAVRFKRAEVVYNGSLFDVVNNVGYNLQGGLIDTFPATRIANKTYEATIRFELIESLVDGGTFAAPLQLVT